MSEQTIQNLNRMRKETGDLYNGPVQRLNALSQSFGLTGNTNMARELSEIASEIADHGNRINRCIHKELEQYKEEA